MAWTIRTQDLVHETMDGEVVIVDLTSGRYYSLLESATAIWLGLEAGLSERGLEKQLRHRYLDPDGKIPTALQAFLQQLEREGLITAAKEPGVDEPPVAEGEPRRPFQQPVLNTHVDMEGLLLLDPVHEVSDAGWPERA